jgi:flagellar biosynthesis/type III secretory pathway protein FliH
MANVLKSPLVRSRTEPSSDSRPLAAVNLSDRSTVTALDTQSKQRSEALAEELVSLRRQLAEADLENTDLRQAIKEQEKAAFEKGVTEGEARARSFVVSLHERTAGAVKAELALTRDALQSVLDDFEQLAVEIALATVDRLVGKTFRERDFVEALVLEQMKALTHGPDIRITLCESDFRDRDAFMTAAGELGFGQSVIFDKTVRAGTCIVELASGSVDASWHSQVSRIYETLQTKRASHEH